jgi:hypothetical protein
MAANCAGSACDIDLASGYEVNSVGTTFSIDRRVVQLSSMHETSIFHSSGHRSSWIKP